MTSCVSRFPTIESCQSVVESYFFLLNKGKFQEASQLFAESGVLVPPFEGAIAGPEAIAHYLTQEASGISIVPLNISVTDDTGEVVTLKATGRVSLSWCQVNVAWQFRIDPDEKIASVEVQLLATLQELLKFQQ